MAKKYNLKHSGATLIITPPAIIKQWEAELRQHAPNLRVKIYDGVKRDKEMQTETMVEELAGCDVVLTDYTVRYYNTTAGKSSALIALDHAGVEGRGILCSSATRPIKEIW